MFKNYLAGCALLICSALAQSAVINVEFKFTPFVGDSKTEKEVQSVAGKASVYINNVLFAEQPVREDTLPVMFEEREVAPAVWLPVASAGSVVRKGKNKLRIEFEPADAKLAYRAQLRWALVTDQTTEENSHGEHRSTNQTGEGVEEKQVTGKIVMEREFQADFATDLPWHHYPPVKELTDSDKKALSALLKARTEMFKPKFDRIYAMLKDHPNIKVNEVKKMKCLDKVYKLGARIVVAPAAEVSFATTGGPEVLISSGGGELFRPADMSVFERIKDEDEQMCVGMTLFAVYPPRMTVVRNPAGAWEVVR